MLTAARVALLATAILASTASTASAGTVATFPSIAESRTFATTNGGWASSIDYGGLVCIPGVTCPPATPSFQATNGAAGVGDGFVRYSHGTLLGVLSTTTIWWKSPTFVAPAEADAAKLRFSVRPQIASLLAIGSVTVKARIVDTGDSSVAWTQDVPLTVPSASFGQRELTVDPTKLVEGRSYRIELGSAMTTSVSAVTSGNVDIDNVALDLVELLLPTGLTGTFAPTGAPRVTGGVDPQGMTTTVKVQYGPTAAYGSESAPETVDGTGSQPFDIPLTGLTPGQTYHYRVVAENADGTSATSDDTFVAAVPPSDDPPAIAGADNSRARTATFTRDSDVVSATVELLQGASVIDTFPDTGDDGSVDVQLPDADGSYGVRVVRENGAGLTSTSASEPVLLDRVAPSVAALGLDVTPQLSAVRQRAISFTRPGDAATVSAQVIDAGSTDVGTPVAVAGGSANVQLGTADGDYRVRLTLTDAAGNSATALSSAVTLDATAPAGGAPTVTGAATGRDREVTFARDASTTHAEIELLDAADGVIASVPLPTGSSTPIELPDADGTYGVRVKQTDGAGNTGTTPKTVITLDRAAPAAGPAPTVSGRPDALVVAFERATDAATATVEVRDASGDDVLTVAVPSGDRATVDLPDADGVYTIRVVQTDAAGNSATTAPTEVKRVTEQPPTKAPEPTPETCTSTPAVLTGVALRGRTVRVTGWSSHPAGTEVTIHNRAGKPLGTAQVDAHGQFAASVKAPRSARGREIASYRAIVGGVQSPAVYLRRANALTGARAEGTIVTLRGRVDVRRAGAVKRIVAFGGACLGELAPLKTLDTDVDRRTGAYTLRVRVPSGDAGRILRTRVVAARFSSLSAFLVP